MYSPNLRFELYEVILRTRPQFTIPQVIAAAAELEAAAAKAAPDDALPVPASFFPGAPVHQFDADGRIIPPGTAPSLMPAVDAAMGLPGMAAAASETEVIRQVQASAPLEQPALAVDPGSQVPT